MTTLGPTRRNAATPIVLCAALFLAGRPAAPQANPGSPELRQTLDRLAAAAEVLEHSLPSLTCFETAVSETLKNGKVKKHVAFSGNVRVVRTPAGHLNETFTLTQVNGKPHTGHGYRFPYYAVGGFEGGILSLPTRQPCYVYTLSSGRIDFATAPGAGSTPPCRDDGVRGFALFDADGNVTHIERSVSAQATRDFHLTPFAAFDFAPIELNGRTYRPPHHVISETPEDPGAGRMESTYSNCQLYTASVTILPPTQVVPGGPAPSQ